MESATTERQATHKPPTPQKEHRWLQKLIGEWTCETEAIAMPGKPALKQKATESVHSLGGLWVVAAGQGEMPGAGTVYTQMTLGYDPGKKRFVGSWVGSMLTQQWVYEGTLDEATHTLTLDCEGPSMSDNGKTAQYRDVIVFKSDDQRVLTSHVRGEDGKYRQFMTARYRRK